MSLTYTFPGGSNVYVPTLHQDLMVAYIRNPAKFPIVRYTSSRKVDKMIGYYVQWKNDGQSRMLNQDDFAWADGNDVPMNTQEGDTFEYPSFNCKRRIYFDRVGYLAVEQGSWDVLGKKAAEQTMKGMTARSLRVANTLSTAANYPSANQITSSVTGGATWGNASSTTPAIRKTIMTLANNVMKATLGVVQFNDLYVVLNPNTAQVVATSAEWIDFVKQSPSILDSWHGDGQFLTYGIPSKAFGMNWVVDDTVYTSNLAGATKVTNFTFPDNVAVLTTKQQAIAGFESSAFSTFELFVYQDFETFVYNDVRNKRYELQITENVDDSFLFASDSGGIILTNS